MQDPSAGAVPEASPVKILVVDDEPDLEHLIRQKFRRKIRSKEFDFVFANSGVEAIEKLKGDGEIDLVLTDINMPEMDGLTLLGEIGKFDQLLKSVVVSAYGDMDNIRAAMNLGAFDFVTKPIDLTDLETTINQSLGELRILKDAIRSRNELVAIQRELDVATDIQTSILPRKFPPFPDRKEIEIFARMIPAKEVGGDFYDFFLVDDDRLGFVIGDVSGKGVPAAIMMAVSRTLLRSTAAEGVAPSACCRVVNELLTADSPSDLFVTAFYGILDMRDGTLEYCSAGHNPPYFLSADGRVTRGDNSGGIFLGAMPNMDFESGKMILQPGDAIVVYTDGVTEAQNTQDELFDDARLEESLGGVVRESADSIVDKLIGRVKEFAGTAPQSDDITCLVLRYLGQQ
jgi:sigma-B regulation protein RsbU (phosphoserine phosphatase)